MSSAITLIADFEEAENAALIHFVILRGGRQGSCARLLNACKEPLVR